MNSEKEVQNGASS